MQLIDNVNQAPKMLSMIGAAVLVVFNVLNAALPEVRAMFTPETFATINALIGTGIAIGRVLKQTSVSGS